MKQLLVKSYAKINICLNIKGKTENGYHNLDMVMVPLELHDSLLLSEIKNTTDNYVTIDNFSIGSQNYNLATFAIDKLAEKYHFNNKFRILIHKVIPIQAGLGGGSSNAAFTIKGVDKFLNLKASKEDLMDISRDLGCDVPFFLDCVPARCQGVGDVLTPITIKNDYYVLIVQPNKGCSTKEVYNLSDEMTLKTGNVDDVVKALEEGNDELLAHSIFNSLEEPALKIVPEIAEIEQKLHNYGLNIVLMTGSGSAVFALSTNKKLLKRIGEDMEEHYNVELTKILK